jgi:hypothetical protein
VSEDARDEDWLDARERGDSIDHIDAATRTRYDNLQRHIAALPDGDPPAGWQERVIARLDSNVPPARRRFAAWWLAGGIIAAAALVIIFLMPSHAGEAFELSIDRGNAVYLDVGDLVVHDRLRIHAASRLAAVRVYSARGRMLAGCPGGPNCIRGDIVLELAAPDVLTIVGLGGCTPPPVGDDYAADAVAARVAHCTVVSHKPLPVR